MKYLGFAFVGLTLCAVGVWLYFALRTLGAASYDEHEDLIK